MSVGGTWSGLRWWWIGGALNEQYHVSDRTFKLSNSSRLLPFHFTTCSYFRNLLNFSFGSLATAYASFAQILVSEAVKVIVILCEQSVIESQ